MSKSPSPEPQLSLSSRPRELNGPAGMDDQENTIAIVAQFVEQLHTKMSSPAEKDLITTRLLGIAKARKDARLLIDSHTQALGLFWGDSFEASLFFLRRRGEAEEENEDAFANIAEL